MKYRTLDSNGDYSFGKGQQNFLVDAAAVAQAVKTNLLLLQGEWWEDTGNNGLPLFQNILGQTGTPDHVQAADLIVQQRIASTEGVASITSFGSTYDSEVRQYTVSCTITTTFGQTATISNFALGVSL